RRSTPPSRALRGKTWPGRERSDGRASSRIAVRIVVARSCAEMPVVTPSRASIETVKAVSRLAVLCWTIGGRSRRSAIAFVIARQTTPPVWRIMKASRSGVTASAARTRSPSFSRSSSSTRITGRPALSSATSSGTSASPGRRVASGMAGLPQRQDPLDVLGQHVGLEVHAVAGAQAGQRRDLERVRYQRDGEVGRGPVGARPARAADVDDGEAHAVDRHAALGHDLTREPGGGAEAHDVRAWGGVDADDLGHAVHVPRDDVAAERRAGAHRLLEVDAGARLPAGRGPAHRLLDQVDLERAARPGGALDDG